MLIYQLIGWRSVTALSHALPLRLRWPRVRQTGRRGWQVVRYFKGTQEPDTSMRICKCNVHILARVRIIFLTDNAFRDVGHDVLGLRSLKRLEVETVSSRGSFPRATNVLLFFNYFRSGPPRPGSGPAGNFDVNAYFMSEFGRNREQDYLNSKAKVERALSQRPRYDYPSFDSAPRVRIPVDKARE